jgi:hypothetical protein
MSEAALHIYGPEVVQDGNELKFERSRAASESRTTTERAGGDARIGAIGDHVAAKERCPIFAQIC